MAQVNSEEEALNYLFLGDTNRAISETAMNQVRGTTLFLT
jgi:kinesin family protein 6/9